MMERIRQRVGLEEHRFTIHAFERCLDRNISPKDVRQAMLAGEILEQYPEDKYGHSCLIYGMTEAGQILHVQCSVEPIWIITAYDPTLSVHQWDDEFKKRRRHS
jgi:hypothetical protein